MKTCYLRLAPGVEAEPWLQTFDRIKCEQIIVDTTADTGRRSQTFEALLSRMKSGDELIVGSFQMAAPSVEALVILVLSLAERGIDFASLHENFSTIGKSRTTIMTVFDQLAKFGGGPKPSRRHNVHAVSHGRRMGRPRALNDQDAALARVRVLEKGEPVDSVARELRVSRATLYRYLDSEA